MSNPTPTFAGEIQLRRWSESNTQGVQVTFALADSADLDKFKGLDGKRFMAALVLIGDDEQPVMGNPITEKVEKSHLNREPLGDLCWRAVQWCKDPEFLSWMASLAALPAMTEGLARNHILLLCGVESRKELDTDPEAARKFNQIIRIPYQKHLIARGVVR